MIKIKLPILSEVKINKKKLLSNFVDINNIEIQDINLEKSSTV